jgi:hypothetical protein
MVRSENKCIGAYNMHVMIVPKVKKENHPSKQNELTFHTIFIDCPGHQFQLVRLTVSRIAGIFRELGKLFLGSMER